MSSEKHCFCSLEDIPKKNQLIMGGILGKRLWHIFHVYTYVCVCVYLWNDFYNNTNYDIFILFLFFLSSVWTMKPYLEPNYSQFTVYLRLFISLTVTALFKKNSWYEKKIKQRREIKSFHFLLLSLAFRFFFLHS